MTSAEAAEDEGALAGGAEAAAAGVGERLTG